MIDFEEEIFKKVTEQTQEELSDLNIFFSSVEIKQPPRFPYVLFFERDNASSKYLSTQDDMDRYADITYDVQVFSNSQYGRKTEVKRVAYKIDEIMLRMGFQRELMRRVDNYLDATVYRMTLRYRARIDKNGTIYQRRY